MGMFDTIICKLQLPNGKVGIEEQTKEFDCLLSYITIEPDGRLSFDAGHWVEHKSRDDFPAGLNGIFAWQESREWVPNVVESCWTGYLHVDEYCLRVIDGKVEEILPKGSGENHRNSPWTPRTEPRVEHPRELQTGDEIHFKDGTVWSCTTESIGDLDLSIVLVPEPFPKDKDEFDSAEVISLRPWMKVLIEHALDGGAKLVKGVGLPDRCPNCGHQSHGNGICLNMASDNDCNCKGIQ